MINFTTTKEQKNKKLRSENQQTQTKESDKEAKNENQVGLDKYMPVKANSMQSGTHKCLNCSVWCQYVS